MSAGEEWVWQVRLLGGFEARCQNHVIRHFRTRKAAVLFAYLALRPDRLHPRENLIDLLWPDADLIAGRASLRTTLTSLRRQLEPPGIQTEPLFLRQGNHALGLRGASVTTDVALFEARIRAVALSTDPVTRERLLEESFTLYQGELLPGYYDDWILRERERLAALYESAREMRAPGERGQSPATIATPEQAQQEATGTQGAMRLPLPSNRFFGREAEIAQITALLSRESSADTPTRLLTLTGPGGSGKTRLAVEAARRLAADFENRVFFAPLEGVGDADLLASAILERVETQDSPGAAPPLERLAETLSGMPPALLVLDNFEQIVEQGTPLVASLLARVPDLRCLVTSRLRLLLDGEREMLVSPLPLPDAEHENPPALMGVPSIALFVDRAQYARPDFQITPRNAAVLSQLCARLAGIPLAIELCAAWAQTLTPAQMLVRLDQDMELLTSRRRDLPSRHRSLRAAIEGSYQMLTPPLRAFFVRLSVFRGGGTVEAAERVCQEPQALLYLTQLREHSLIDTQEAGDEMRFVMLETLRVFAQEQVSPEEQMSLARRHTACYVALAEESEPQLRGTGQATALARLEADHENIRAVFGRSGSDPESALRLAGALGRFWLVRGYWSEGRNWTRRALAASGGEGSSISRAKALLSAATMAWLLDEYAEAKVLARQSLSLYRESNDCAGIAFAVALLGRVTLLGGDVERATALLEESVSAFRELSDPWDLAQALDVLAFALRDADDYERADRLHEEALSLRRALDDRQGIGVSLSNLGDVAQLQGDWERAAALHEESLIRFRSVSDKSGTAYALCRLAMIALRDGDTARADALHRESLRLSWELRDKRRLAESLERIAAVHGARQEWEAAAGRLAASESVRVSIGAPRAPIEQADFERSVAEAQRSLDAAAFSTGWTRGSAMTLEEAVSSALAATK